MEPVIFAVSLERQSAEWIAPWQRFLSPEKAERLCRMPVEKAGLSLAGELLARYGLGRVFGIPAKDLVFAVAPGGKPYVTKPSGLYFNISHSGTWCVCAVSDVPVGIDIQRMDSVRFDAIAHRYFPPEDRTAYEAADDKKGMFYTLWTKKEALGKCLGVGLRPVPMPDLPMEFRWATIDGQYRLCVCWETAPQNQRFFAKET